MPWIEPALPDALASLSERQRTVVVMVYAADWSYAEVASLLGISRGAVHKHAERAMASLRDCLEVDDED
jgi:RNA polymerase sigma factor (sigma-70 family)